MKRFQFPLIVLLLLTTGVACWCGGYWSAKLWYIKNRVTVADLKVLEERWMGKLDTIGQRADAEVARIEKESVDRFDKIWREE